MTTDINETQEIIEYLKETIDLNLPANATESEKRWYLIGAIDALSMSLKRGDENENNRF